MRVSTSNLLSLGVALCLPLLASAVDIVSFENCYVRFQTPRSGQTPQDARITTLNWPTSGSDVARTINDYFNFKEKNVQLFLNGGISALNYANYIQALCRTSQDGLNLDSTIISVLLPSGVAKVSQVTAPADELDPGNEQASGIFGIRTNQPLSASDWAYTTGALMKQSIAQWEVLWNQNRHPQAGVNLIRADGSPVIMTMSLFLQ
ncbi:uncharacterized protein TRIVIDRAFT_60111 [Trichoderma virens Gv29-8]|uniref:Uncharacterized protein n=1 Tax=Hypocrea virens (strain Gv29-8 / FGSC 10586) TaxID=413071 RepID=G9MSX6_HYPVG|nr:uncharacterized protein TRIVIDRAFT_60111 [Trichoderma virens Gv29-8]EHK23073.1 hypothetical protein TRIVIDRAFT_60111 [Trichoderma virens Gv29-8]UKZ48132.1 hypothetical protein TrVGV298_002368 [Trichoderma virens]